MSGKLDPQIAALLEYIEQANLPSFEDLSYVEARQYYRESSAKLAGERRQDIHAEELQLNTGDRVIAARHYRPLAHQQECLPLLIYYHGGGWCLGDLETHDHVCRWLSALGVCAVIAVDYRLGPEFKFPAAVDDCFDACKAIVELAGSLNIDASRVAVGGDSAGGNLAAVVSMLARDQGGPGLLAQLLVYPATDMMMRFPSHARNGSGYRLTRSAITWFICGYLRQGEDMKDFRASPLLAENHQHLPPALVITAEFDPLLDEGEAYAKQLTNAGVDVEYKCYDGMIHGFFAMPGAVDTSKAALADSANFLRHQFDVH